MPPTRTNAEAGPSNHHASPPYRRRLRFSSPDDEDEDGIPINVTAATSRIGLPKPKPYERFPWPPKGRIISRHIEDDKIVIEYAQLTSNYLREYANGVGEEIRTALQRKLDLEGRIQTITMRSKRTAIRAAISKKRITSFMGQLNQLFENGQPKQRRSPRNGENKENERDSSDSDGSGDEGYAPFHDFLRL
jgi:hypothetical protein